MTLLEKLDAMLAECEKATPGNECWGPSAVDNYPAALRALKKAVETLEYESKQETEVWGTHTVQRFSTPAAAT